MVEGVLLLFTKRQIVGWQDETLMDSPTLMVD